MAQSESLSTGASLFLEMLSRASQETLEAQGLSAAAFQVMSAVHGSRSRIHQARVAARLGLQPSTVSEALTALESRGWIERAPDPRDGRRRSVALTPEGKRRLRAALVEVARIEAAAVEGISAVDLEIANSVLRRAGDNLGRIAAPSGASRSSSPRGVGGC